MGCPVPGCRGFAGVPIRANPWASAAWQDMPPLPGLAASGPMSLCRPEPGEPAPGSPQAGSPPPRLSGAKVPRAKTAAGALVRPTPPPPFPHVFRIRGLIEDVKNLGCNYGNLNIAGAGSGGFTHHSDLPPVHPTLRFFIGKTALLITPKHGYSIWSVQKRHRFAHILV